MATGKPVPEELAGIVREAAAAVASQLPSATPLSAGKPQIGLSGLSLPTGSAAVSAGIRGALTGTMVIVVSPELADAVAADVPGSGLLDGTRPALDAAGTALGEVTVAQPLELPAELSVESLRAHPIVVAVPLEADATPLGLFLVGADLPQPSAPKPPTRPSGSALDLLRDVELEVTVELGRTKLTVRELLGMAPGTLVELDRAAGSPADLLVNGTLVARGEVVVVDEDFGLRITEIAGAEAALTAGPE